MWSEVRSQPMAWFADVSYHKENGPSVSSPERVLELGLNCQLFVHLVYDEYFPYLSALPKEMRSSELFSDHQYLLDVTRGRQGFSSTMASDFMPGDILLLGPANLSPVADPTNVHAQQLHVAVVFELGAAHENQDEVVADPWILHASYYARKSNKWLVPEQLSQVMDHPRYNVLFAARRVKESPHLSAQDWAEFLAFDELGSFQMNQAMHAFSERHSFTFLKQFNLKASIF